MKASELFDRFADNPRRPAILFNEEDEYSYLWLAAAAGFWRWSLEEAGVYPGTVVALEGPTSGQWCSALFGLLACDAIVVPLISCPPAARDRLLETAQVEITVQAPGNGTPVIERVNWTVDHPLLQELRETETPGLVLFTSGSAGQKKAVLHDASRLLARYTGAPRASRTLSFFQWDHIGGLNTLFRVLAGGGALVVPRARDADSVCAQIHRHRVQLLPTTPTFLNLLLLSEAYRRHDLSSLKRVTYGAEPMREATLRRLREALPHVEFTQTYGLSELGILRAQSKSSDSLLMRVGGEGYETKVVDGVLWIRARSAMVGYLNAPCPFDLDGWFNTGDEVAVEGDYLRVLGRRSEAINVGGEKVHPAEVESVILELPNIADVTVRGEPNPITGQMVVAEIAVREQEDATSLRRRVKEHCRTRLAPFQTPAKVVVREFSPPAEAVKKMRYAPDAADGDALD